MSQGVVPFDKSPVDLSEGLRVRRARVLWREGTLYVATTRTDVATYAAANPPSDIISGRWIITLDDGRKVKLTKRGCPCSYSLAKVAATELLTNAGVVLA